MELFQLFLIGLVIIIAVAVLSTKTFSPQKYGGCSSGSCSKMAHGGCSAGMCHV